MMTDITALQRAGQNKGRVTVVRNLSTRHVQGNLVLQQLLEQATGPTEELIDADGHEVYTHGVTPMDPANTDLRIY